MSENKNNKKYIIGLVGEGKSTKCTLASAIAKICSIDSSLSDMVSDKNLGVIVEDSTVSQVENKPTYILESIFPNKEVQDIAMAEVYRMNKIKLCEELGLVYENIDDVSWEVINEEISKQKKDTKRKVFAKKRRGV